jgi:hypothetical protein
LINAYYYPTRGVKIGIDIIFWSLLAGVDAACVCRPAPTRSASGAYHRRLPAPGLSPMA